MSEHIFLPQYSAQAVIDLEEFARHNRSNAQLYAYNQSCLGIAQVIREATHIVLPPNGQIYRPNMGVPTKDECESFVGLPAPVTCFEYPWTYKDPVAQFQARKRIVIAIDGKQVANAANDLVALFSVCHDERFDAFTLLDSCLSVTQPLQVSAGTTKNGWGLKSALRNLINEEYIEPEVVLNDPRWRMIFSQFMPDISAVVQCCHSLRAGAALDERSEPSSTRRRKFEKKGVGGFTYHVLKIPRVGIVSSHASRGGTHASPRFHLRRSHIRKLPTGLLTFVRQHFVGDTERGRVDKHYELQSKGPDHV